MVWARFSLGAALFWGAYGPILHKGQLQLGNPLRALLCVGFAYFLVGGVKFLSFRPFRVWITEGDLRRDFDALQVLLANGRYFGGMLVAHDASPESRNVTVQIIKGSSRWNLIRAWWAIAAGRRPDPEIVAEFVISDAMIEAEPQQYVSIDGEVAAQTPIHITMAPEALIVMVPAEFDDSDDDRRNTLRSERTT